MSKKSRRFARNQKYSPKSQWVGGSPQRPVDKDVFGPGTITFKIGYDGTSESVIEGLPPSDAGGQTRE